MLDIFDYIFGGDVSDITHRSELSDDLNFDSSFDTMDWETYSYDAYMPDATIGMSDSNPYASGFDEDHPLPSYDELRNAGFTDFEAKQITYHTYTVFSEKELFEVLYSDNPKEAYDAMMREKLDNLDDHINRLITSI